MTNATLNFNQKPIMSLTTIELTLKSYESGFELCDFELENLAKLSDDVFSPFEEVVRKLEKSPDRRLQIYLKNRDAIFSIRNNTYAYKDPDTNVSR